MSCWNITFPPFQPRLERCSSYFADLSLYVLNFVLKLFLINVRIHSVKLDVLILYLVPLNLRLGLFLVCLFVVLSLDVLITFALTPCQFLSIQPGTGHEIDMRGMRGYVYLPSHCWQRSCRFRQRVQITEMWHFCAATWARITADHVAAIGLAPLRRLTAKLNVK